MGWLDGMTYDEGGWGRHLDGGMSPVVTGLRVDEKGRWASREFVRF